jgi:hypothetical protein
LENLKKKREKEKRSEIFVGAESFDDDSTEVDVVDRIDVSKLAMEEESIN